MSDKRPPYLQLADALWGDTPSLTSTDGSARYNAAPFMAVTFVQMLLWLIGVPHIPAAMEEFMSRYR